MTKASDNAFPSILITEGTEPAAPAAGKQRLYIDSTTHKLKRTDSAGADVDLEPSASTSDHNHDGSGGSGGDLDSPVIDGFAIFNEESAPSTPASGTVALYAKSDGRIYSKDDAGVEYGPFDVAGGGGASIFPQMAAVAATDISANGTSHVVNLPAGIVAGQVLLILAIIDGTATISASGWTAMTGVAIQSTGNCSLAVLWKFASGSEGASVTVTASASEKARYYAIRVSGAHASTPPEGTSAQSGSAAATSIPIALTPSWGSDDNLWISFTGHDASSDASITYVRGPVEYCYKTHVAAGATDSVSIVVSYREFTGTTQTPGGHTATASEQWVTATVAVRPS